MNDQIRSTPAEIAGIDPSLLARLRPTSDEQRFSEPRVLLPTLKVEGYDGWLCWVCLRDVVPNHQPPSWLACEHCRAVDRRVATVLDASHFLPLSQDPTINQLNAFRPASDPMAIPFGQPRTTTIPEWDGLNDWREENAAVLAWIIPAIMGDDLDEIPLSCWTEMVDPGPEASAREYQRLLQTRFPWVIERDARLADSEWLAGGSRGER